MMYSIEDDLYVSNVQNNKLSMVWMISFADLLSLMLTFFILLYSMSEINLSEWQKVSSSFIEEMNPDEGDQDTALTVEETVFKEENAKAHDLDYLYAVLYGKLRKEAYLFEDIQLHKKEGSLIISIANQALFDEGKTELSVRAISLMFLIEGLLYAIENEVEVYAEVGSATLETEKTSSNWEFSLAKAITVAKELKKSGYMYKINAFGFVDSHDDKPSSDTKGLDHKKNKGRVDIIIRDKIVNL